jgi:hypothetical protein
MKTWPPLPHPVDAPQTRRRIPAFHPVPVGARKDGWTPRRQAEFIGFLAESRSVEGACRRVGMGKHSAYRLRQRAGAAGFAAAWDAALGKLRSAVDLDSAKSTGLDAEYRSRMGLMQVVMERGRFSGSYWKDDANAFLQHIARFDRSEAAEARLEQSLRSLEREEASHPGGDFKPEPRSLPGLGAPLYAVPEWCSTPELRAAFEQMVAKGP